MGPEDVRLQLLGPVRVQRGGHDVFTGSGQRAAVLAVLALHGDVSREQIVAAVWGDDPPASAGGNVYTHVNALREVLGAALLTRVDGAYRLHLPEPALDAVRFEQLRELARRHRAAGDQPAELAALQDSLRLWHGDALAGVPGPYAEAQRARLHELRLASEQRHAEVLLELGRPADAITALHPLVAAHRMQESLHGLLMVALHAAGRRAEALAVYEDFSAVLLRENGTEPAPALRRTRERIVEIDAQVATGDRRTRDVLRAVAFLGDGATVGEVCQVTGLPRTAVEQDVEAARAGAVLAAAGPLRFRDPVVGRDLHAGTPAALRSAVHGFFAEVIADSFGPPERVAAHLLLTAPAPLTSKASRWLLEHIEELAARSPAEVITLLQRVHLQHLSDRETHLALSVWLARLLFGQGRDAVPEAGWVAARSSDDPDVQAEMLWIAASSHDRQGHYVAAAEVARSMLSARRHPQPWLDRFREMILRLRLSLPGEPTAPRHSRPAVVSAKKIAAYRRTITTDG